MTLAPLSGSFRPGGPTTPRPVRGSGSGLPESYHLQFLTAEERSTAVLMGYFQDARLEIEDYIRNTGDLSVADATYYRQLLDETNRIASKLNSQGAKWTSSTIDEAYSAGWRQNSSIVVPQKALEALSRDTLSLISQTTDGIRQMVRQSIAQGILQGLPADQVRARILASGLTNIPHWPSAEYRAGVIARTETMRAYNAGHLAAMEENGARYAEWIASPDEAVCSICGPRDGVIFRLDAGMDLVDPYPNAQSLPKLPAHPRCRCTTRPVYRDPDGKVIGTPNAQDPKLPKDAMGGKDKPLVPPAAGDFMASLKSLDKLDDTARAYWRSLDLDGMAPGGRNYLTVLAQDLSQKRFGALMQARYGINLKVAGPWSGFDVRYKLGMLRALETYEKAGFRWRDSPALTTIEFRQKLRGLRNPGVFRSHQSTIELAMSVYARTHSAYRLGTRDYFESSMIHELGHALDWHSFRIATGANAYKAGSSPFTAIHKATGVSGGTAGAKAKVEASIARAREDMQASLDRIAKIEAEANGDLSSLLGWQQRSLDTHRELIPRYVSQIDAMQKLLKEIEANGDVGSFVTSYASNNEFEDFADSVVAYLLDPAKLKADSPKRYEFVRNVFGGKE